MRSPFIAFLLSFFVPGAGLAYLGRWIWALANLGLFLLVAVSSAVLLPEDFFMRHVRTISMTCAAASAVFAHITAVRMKRAHERQLNDPDWDAASGADADADPRADTDMDAETWSGDAPDSAPQRGNF